PGVVMDLGIKIGNGAGILVGRGIEHLATPQHIVSQDVPVQIYMIYHQIEVTRIIFFIRVDEYKVITFIEGRKYGAGIPDAVIDTILDAGLGKPPRDAVEQLFIDVNGN